MRDLEELIVTYLVKLENAGIYSVQLVEIDWYLSSIGIKGCEASIDLLMKNKILLRLKNGKVTLNKLKRKKKQ